MITLNNYKENVLGTTSIGLKHRLNSANVIERTWDRDIQSRDCYIYDYFHDSEPFKTVGLHSNEDELKTKIKAKYVEIYYNTLAKDQVEYHLEFMPSQECNIDYYDEILGKPYGAEFPIGLYIDIPEGKKLDIYRRWLICGKNYNQEFISYIILPCKEVYHWVEDDGKNGILRDMCGAMRTQSSYNSGIWLDYMVETTENQDKFWLPKNSISDKIFYNQRIVISSYDVTKSQDQDTIEPITWKLSKVENAKTRGINNFTIVQEKFNSQAEKKIYREETGEYYWYANYNKATLQEKPIVPINENYCVLACQSSNNDILVGGVSYKTLTCNCFNGENVDITSNYSFDETLWNFSVNGIDIKDIFTIKYTNNIIKFKLKTGFGDDYIGKELTVSINIEGLNTCNYKFNIIC